MHVVRDQMSSTLVSIGLLLLVVAIALIFIGASHNEGRTKIAVGGFIGPIPFGFGNDPEFVKFTTVLSLILLVIFLVVHFA